jgi:hypothetical protein
MMAQDVTYNFDQTANFAKYHTYKWVALPNTAYPNQLVDNQIRRPSIPNSRRRASLRRWAPIQICMLLIR